MNPRDALQSRRWPEGQLRVVGGIVAGGGHRQTDKHRSAQRYTPIRVLRITTVPLPLPLLLLLQLLLQQLLHLAVPVVDGPFVALAGGRRNPLRRLVCTML
jgi:hypothetical protein